MLAAKANVNAAATGYGGRTALQAAAEGGRLEVVEKLLAANADINAAGAAGYSGRTAMQAAAGGSHFDVVERLLTANADVNAGSDGLTALQAAAGAATQR
jgi:ankyrin repeat protein